jgi:hypothetical protein
VRSLKLHEITDLAVVCKPEKAGVGGSTPSRGTIESTTYKSSEAKTCSNLFLNSNPGPAEVCLRLSSAKAEKYLQSGLPLAEALLPAHRAL